MASNRAKLQAALLKRKEEKKNQAKGSATAGAEKDPKPASVSEANGEDGAPEDVPAEEQNEAQRKLAERKKAMEEKERLLQESYEAEKKRIEEETRKAKAEAEARIRQEEEERRRQEEEVAKARAAAEKEKRETFALECILPAGYLATPGPIRLRLPRKTTVEQLKNKLLEDVPPRLKKAPHFIVIDGISLEREHVKLAEPPAHPAIGRAIDADTAVVVHCMSDVDLKALRNPKAALKESAARSEPPSSSVSASSSSSSIATTTDSTPLETSSSSNAVSKESSTTTPRVSTAGAAPEKPAWKVAEEERQKREADRLAAIAERKKKDEEERLIREKAEKLAIAELEAKAIADEKARKQREEEARLEKIRQAELKKKEEEERKKAEAEAKRREEEARQRAEEERLKAEEDARKAKAAAEAEAREKVKAEQRAKIFGSPDPAAEENATSKKALTLFQQQDKARAEAEKKRLEDLEKKIEARKKARASVAITGGVDLSAYSDSPAGTPTKPAAVPTLDTASRASTAGDHALDSRASTAGEPEVKREVIVKKTPRDSSSGSTAIISPRNDDESIEDLERRLDALDAELMKVIKFKGPREKAIKRTRPGGAKTCNVRDLDVNLIKKVPIAPGMSMSAFNSAIQKAFGHTREIVSVKDDKTSTYMVDDDDVKNFAVEGALLDVIFE